MLTFNILGLWITNETEQKARGRQSVDLISIRLKYN